MPEIRLARSLEFPDAPSLRYLPEGPVALGMGVFSWVAIQHGEGVTHGSLNLFRGSGPAGAAAGPAGSFELPGRPGFAFPCQAPAHDIPDRDIPAHFVVGCERELGLFRVDGEGGHWRPFCSGIDRDVEGTIINDGMVWEDNLIFGTKDLEFRTKKAGLYLWRGRDRTLIRLRDDQICSNGKAIRPLSDGPEAGLQLIDIDSPTRQVVGYPLDIGRGRLGEPRVLIDLTGDPGVPDGAILTPDGRGLIVSLFRPEPAEYGETRLYDLDSGEPKIVWRTPGSPQNTCPALVAWGGEEDPSGPAVRLVITTAVEHMSESDRRRCPHAGEIFWGETDYAVSDLPSTPRFPLTAANGVTG